MKNVSINICTRQRIENLVLCLESIARLKVPSGIDLSVIVVENDTKNFSQHAVESFQNRLNIRYLLEPNIGISSARNRHISETGNMHKIIFVDDDQTVDKFWLEEILDCQKKTCAEVVANTVFPIFEDNEISSYLRAYHTPNRFSEDKVLLTAATSGLLIDRAIIERHNLSFDKSFDFTGGEDTLFTMYISHLGYKIVRSHKAIIYELVQSNRLNLSWILKRTRSGTASHIKVLNIIGDKKLIREYKKDMFFRFIKMFVFLPLLMTKSGKKYRSLQIFYSIMGLIDYSRKKSIKVY